MVPKGLKIGDLVWAKMKGYPFWPGKIIAPPESSSTRKAQHYVYFFGSKNCAWTKDELIKLHSEEMYRDAAGKKKFAHFQEGIDEMRKLGDHPLKDRNIEEPEVIEIPEAPASTEKIRLEKPKSKVIKITPEKKKKEVLKVAKRVSVPKKSEKRKLSESTCSPVKCQKMDDEYSNLIANLPPNNNDKSFSLFSAIKTEDKQSHPSSNLLREEYIPRPPTPSLDVAKVSETLQSKIAERGVNPTEKKIGFLGLGMMGRGLVKNLINSGHDVTVWNRTSEKCEEFKNYGAKVMMTPSDVVAACDITFSCVSEPEVVKTLVIGNCGVLKGLEGQTVGSKGYVEMSSIDPVTSSEIAEAITDKGGRYLEAPINGNRHMAEEGTLLILGAGDRELFNDCESCFFAISKNAYYLSCTVGDGSKMNLITNMLLGTTYAALAEAIALVKKCHLSTNNFLEILALGPFSSSIVVEKGQSMVNKEFPLNTALRHQQKDLHLALQIGNACEQPMLVTAAANEIFKHARRRRYSDHDVAAVLFGAEQ